MSDKFTESMEVEAVGNLKPGDIGWGTCDGCEKNIHKFPGVLLQGVTQEAAKLLYKQCEIVPVGTTAEIERLKEINADLLDAAAHCCLLACECDGWCHSMLSLVKGGKCDLLDREGCYIWDAIQKAGGEKE